MLDCQGEVARLQIATFALASGADLKRIWIPSVGAFFRRFRATATDRHAAVVFLGLFTIYACFAQLGPNANTTSRLALTASWVQGHGIDIDGYETLTIDRAFYNGHYFCDKAPTMSFLAAPIAFAYTRLVPLAPEDTFSRSWTGLLYLCTLFTSGLISALTGAALFRVLLNRTGNMGAALAATGAFGLATPIMMWSTAFFGHATAGALILAAYLAFDAEKLSVARAGLGGVLLGLAVGVEYTAAVPACIMGGALLLRTASRIGWIPAVQRFSLATFVGALAFSPVLFYNAAAFGNPFSLGYSHLESFGGMKTGFFGIGLPRLEVIEDLTIGLRRGALWYAPSVVALGLGVAHTLKRRELRLAGLVALLTAAWYLLYNAGYVYWDGGESTGPRHLTAAFGLPCLSIGLAWSSFSEWTRRLAMVSLWLGGAVSWAGAAVSTTAPGGFSNPLLQYVLPNLAAGRVSGVLTHQLLDVDSPLHLLPPILIALLAWRLLHGRQTALPSGV